MENRKTKRVRSSNSVVYLIGLFMVLWILPQNALAHCDSYDGPVIQDALKALDQDNVTLVYKWISEDQEEEISDLFQKTLKYQKKDKEVYQLLEKHFLETLVRLHREGEGAPYTGLKPAGTTKPIIVMTDEALQDEDPETLFGNLENHIEKVIREKYDKALQLRQVQNESVQQGRAYVAAYVDYTHTVEALHDVITHDTAKHKH
ncbi:DUF6448 family protein [Salinimicrobium sediminilitoris]|uniref:DUF6448 family protein n=1 Tax=Salinimicrobium sediminilitoris TaxID=2876715 RepID=UPI001E28E7B6|nr:DUF6448 family protein [Salinimicrobium sediminilitoris]MCC8358332.1 DUF6448 family protein [Salinimicrobium sediminilitoris]